MRGRRAKLLLFALILLAWLGIMFGGLLAQGASTDAAKDLRPPPCPPGQVRYAGKCVNKSTGADDCAKEGRK
jgi:hypothetical protein